MTRIATDLRSRAVGQRRFQRLPSATLPTTSPRKTNGSPRRSRSGLITASFIAAFLLCVGITLNGIGVSITPSPFGRALTALPAPAANQQLPPQIASDQGINASTLPTTDQQIVDAMQRLREKLFEVKHLVSNEGTSEDVFQLPLTEATVSSDVPKDEASHRSIERADDIKEIQKRLASLGYFAGPVIGVWGPRSRDALRVFKEVNSLPTNMRWDAETEAVLFSGNAKEANFSGNWAVDLESCSSFPVVLEKSGAKAGDTSCVFGKTRLVMGAWDISATCSNARERWSTRVRLALSGRKLTWSSQRGTETYFRCDPQLSVASAR